MKRAPLIFFIIISLVCLGYTYQYRWKSGMWQTTIRSDGSGYYSYLPCIFIYHNFDFSKQEKFNPWIKAAYSENNGNQLNKYFAGVSFLLTPFFLIALFLSYLSGYSIDGYSLFFELSVSVGALFYLLFGLIFLRKLLKEFQLPDWVIYLSVTITLFGTNLFYYTTIEPSMSHTYSFAFMALFLYSIKRFTDSGLAKHLIYTVIALSILVLIRPTNIFCLGIVPFMAGSLSSLKQLVRIILRAKNMIFCITVPFLFFCIQMLIWHAETGHFLVWSYSHEGFFFNRPHFREILFSYRKGWFIYTPAMLIAIFGGLFALYKQNRYRFYSFLIFFIPLTYVLSCWWNWIYGDSYGMRAFIDFYPVFALLLGFFLNSLITTWLRILTVLVSILCIGLNIVQIYQYNTMILSHDSMSMNRYWKVFLKTGKEYGNIFYTNNINDLDYYNGLDYENDFEHNAWGNDENISDSNGFNSNRSAFVDDKHLYGPTLVLKASDLPIGDDIYAYFDLWVKSADTANTAFIMVNTQSADGIINEWNSLTVRCKKACEWENMHGAIQLPPIASPSDIIKIYASYNKGKVYFDDLKIKLGRPE